MQLPNHNVWAKGGLMVRANNSAGSPYVIVGLTNGGPDDATYTGDHDLTFQWRDVQDGDAAWDDATGAETNNGPAQLLLNRQANNTGVAAGYDTLGDPGPAEPFWVSHDAPNIPITPGETILVGLAFTSHSEGNVSSAMFYDVSLDAVGVGLQAPTNLTALVIPPDVLLNWEDNSQIEDGYAIERREGAAGTWTEIARVGASVRDYIDANVPEGIYYYRVKAFSASEDSDYAQIGPVDVGGALEAKRWQLYR
jgi:hypothetical protein